MTEGRDESNLPVTGSRWVVGILAAATATWRLWDVPVAGLWRDTVLLLSLHAGVLLLVRSEGVRRTVTAALAGYLLGLYVHGQIPHVLSVLRGSP